MKRILLGECCHQGKIQARRCQILTKMCQENALQEDDHKSELFQEDDHKHFQIEVKSELEGFSSCV